jgi:hypothetical protein
MSGLIATRCQRTERNNNSGVRSSLIEEVPHIYQKPDFSGEAAAAMYLRKLGHQVDQEALFNRSTTGIIGNVLQGIYRKSNDRSDWYSHSIERAG